MANGYGEIRLHGFHGWDIDLNSGFQCWHAVNERPFLGFPAKSFLPYGMAPARPTIFKETFPKNRFCSRDALHERPEKPSQKDPHRF